MSNMIVTLRFVVGGKNERARFHAASTRLAGPYRGEKEMRGVAVLGPVRVLVEDGSPVALGSRRQCLLLAILVSRHGRMVRADELVEALWGGDLPAHPAAALQSQVFRLRRALATSGVSVDSNGAGYCLAAAGGVLDVERFEDLVAQARHRSAEPAVAIGLFDEAFGWWRGRPYAEVADHESVLAEAERLVELHADAAEARAELLLELAAATEAATAAEAVMGEHPFRERPVAIRMRALARAGRHAEALRVFEVFRRTLGDELGLEPSPDLRAVEGDILRHDTAVMPRIGLPGNSLVGREVELAELAGCLAEGRLVTLTGPGGVGKTRLALHAAARAAPGYPDGVWLCELATVGTNDAVAVAVASVLHVERDREHGDVERIVRFLRSRRALLVLDNCEHVLDAAGDLVGSVLAHAPDVDVLATSRRRLGVDGEHVAPVAPLPVGATPGVDSPAVALFVDRAKAMRGDFPVTPDNRAAVDALCRCLDGLPLALELAAARTVSRTTGEILAEVTERIDQLGDPLRSRERHRSMAAVVDWSYGRLDPGEQHLFRRAAVFAGGFDAGAAAAVAGVDLDEAVAGATSLVEHSLIAARDVAGTTRYSMLEPIRQFAEARLTGVGEADGAQAQHAAWAARWIETADAGLRSPSEARWAAAVAAELPNLRAAQRWSVVHEPRTAARIAGAMYWYAYWFGASEAFDWAAASIAAVDADAAEVAGACATAALGAARRGDIDGARTLAERGVAAARQPADARFAWQARSSAEVMAGTYEQALDCQQHALDLAHLLGDTTHQAREHAARALVFGYLGRSDDAERELAVADDAARAAASPTAQAFRDYVAGEIRIDTDPTGSLEQFGRARDLARHIGNQYLAAIAGVSAVSCAARTGDPVHALGGYAELLDYFDRAGSRAQQWTTIRTLIETLIQLDHDEQAAILYGALTASPTALPLIGPDATRMHDAATTLATRLGHHQYEQLTTKGAGLDDDEAIAYARRATLDDRSQP
jgi:predicted ATPase/DNA-binding SARP family transcriptional activator